MKYSVVLALVVLALIVVSGCTQSDSGSPTNISVSQVTTTSTAKMVYIAPTMTQAYIIPNVNGPTPTTIPTKVITILVTRAPTTIHPNIQVPIQTSIITQTPALIRKMAVIEDHGSLSSDGRMYTVSAVVENVGNTPGWADCEVIFYDYQGNYITTTGKMSRNYLSVGETTSLSFRCYLDSNNAYNGRSTIFGKYSISVKSVIN